MTLALTPPPRPPEYQVPEIVSAPPPSFVPGTVKPEEDYEELQRLSRKLGLPCPQSFLELEARDADGNVTGQIKDRSRTLNRNFWNTLFLSIGAFTAPAASPASFRTLSTSFGAGFLSLKSTIGTVPATSTQWFVPFIANAAGSGTTGITVGTGTAVESFDGFVLATPIVQGTGAGQMSYQDNLVGSTSYNAGTLTWTATITRILNNNSGGTIGVNETAIYTSTGGVTVMVARDKLGGTVNVLNGGQLTVTYTNTLTFPA